MLFRSDAGRWEVTIEDVDLGAMLETVINGFRQVASARGLSLRLEAGSGLSEVWTDARIVREIATNLVDNAIKYTQHGAIVVRSAVDDDGDLHLEVVDTGVGIPADRLESIFDEFEQIRLPQMQDGSGLGLAIARRLVSLLGGTIRVASTVGAGSVFTVHLPGVRRAAQPHAK